MCAEFLFTSNIKMRCSVVLIFVLTIVFASSASIESIDDETLIEIFTRGIDEYFATGEESSDFKLAAQKIRLPNLLNHHLAKSLELPSPICGLCSIFTNRVVAQRKAGKTKEELAKKLIGICERFRIEDDRVCTGFIDLNLDTILYIVDNGQNVGDRLCAILLQDRNCAYKTLNFNWSVQIPAGETVEKKPRSNNETFNILHLSDFHYDPMYTPGITNECGEPMCCQSDQAVGKTPSTQCGYWSEYKDADAPWHLITEVFRQANDNHAFDYVYFTGDIISHRVWDTSVAHNSRDISKIFNQMKESFKVPVYPVLGNHESNPLNLWNDRKVNKSISQQWLYDLVAEEWMAWLPQETKSTISRCGYYTVTPKKGFRIIALNSNVCYSLNWWLALDDKDPCGQLQWLSDTLKLAEANQESVHILSHIPTGDSTCFKLWSREFNRILARFANTITGIFNGHTHMDEFDVYYDTTTATPKVLNAAFNGASVTTYTNNNPSYKIFKADDKSLRLLDYEEWTFNLTQANLNPEKPIDWYKLYTFTEAYGVESLDPEEVHKVVMKMTTDHNLILKYNEFRYRNADPALAVKCDVKCQRTTLCEIVTTQYGENKMCDTVKALYDKSKLI